MTCLDCQSPCTFTMTCIDCAARHCKMIFYPPLVSRWDYVKNVALRHGHNPRELAERVKSLNG